MEKLLEQIEKELEQIASRGFNHSNIDDASKLVDMMKDLKEAGMGGYSSRYRDDYSGHDWEDGESYEGGTSYARRGTHYVRGHYSRNDGYSDRYSEEGPYNRYLVSKASYRAHKSGDCHERMMTNLEECMDDFTKRMEMMLKDSDCAEERSTIKRYIDKLKNIT